MRRRPAEPFYFLKPTSSYLLPGQGPVELTRGSVIHYEGEASERVATSRPAVARCVITPAVAEYLRMEKTLC